MVILYFLVTFRKERLGHGTMSLKLRTIHLKLEPNLAGANGVLM